LEAKETVKEQTLLPTEKLQDLLAHRDGERLDPDVAASIEASAEDRATVQSLREIKHQLGDLDEVAPPAGLWEQIEKQGAAPVRSNRMPFQLATAAAVFVAAALTIVVFNPLQKNGDIPATIEPRAQVTSLPALLDESQRLETLVSAAVVQPADSAQQALVYRITDIDEELTRLATSDVPDNARIAELWRQRVALLESLMEVQRGEASQRTAVY
jgi:hypothetical protein